MIDGLKRRVMAMVARAITGPVDDSPMMQSVQIEVLDGELHDNVERFQNYGLTSVPQPGAEAIVVRVGGTASHGVVIVIDDRRFRMRGLAEGEVALHDDLGQAVHLARDGMRLVSPMKVIVEAPEVLIDADRVDLGGSGGAAVARIGDTVAGGMITGGSSKVFSA